MYNNCVVSQLKDAIKRNGQDISFSHSTHSVPYLKTKALATFSRQKYQDEEFKICISDMYKFITREKPTISQFIYWNGGVYKITSIDNSVKGVYKSLCEYIQPYKSRYVLKIAPTDSNNIKINTTCQLEVTLYKDEELITDMTDYKINWSSIDNTIATIDDNGLIIAKKVGSTTITATLDKDNNITASYTINVTSEDITLSIVGDDRISNCANYTYNLSDGRTTVRYTLTSENVHSEDSSYYYFEQNKGAGVYQISWHKEGFDDILHLKAYSTISDNLLCEKDIIVDVHTYTFSLNTIPDINVGDTTNVITNITKDGEKITSNEVTYVSSNTDVATVDNNGVVTGISVGNCNITATFNGISDTKSITVNAGVILPTIDSDDYDDGGDWLGVGRINSYGTYTFTLKPTATVPIKVYLDYSNMNKMFVGDDFKMSKNTTGYGQNKLIMTINKTTSNTYTGTLIIYGKGEDKVRRYEKRIEINL